MTREGTTLSPRIDAVTCWYVDHALPLRLQLILDRVVDARSARKGTEDSGASGGPEISLKDTGFFYERSTAYGTLILVKKDHVRPGL